MTLPNALIVSLLPLLILGLVPSVILSPDLFGAKNLAPSQTSELLTETEDTPGNELGDEGLLAGYPYAHSHSQGHGDFGQDLLDGFLERLPLLFAHLISDSDQPGYDIGCLEMQVTSLRLLLQKFSEL